MSKLLSRIMMKDGGFFPVTDELVEQFIAKSRYVQAKNRKAAFELVSGNDISDSNFIEIEKLIAKYMSDKGIADNQYIIKKDTPLAEEIRRYGTKRVKIYHKGDSICLLLGYRYKMKRYVLRKDLDLELINEGELSEPFLTVGIDFMADWMGQLTQELKRVGADGIYSNELLEEAEKLKVELMNTGELGELLDDYTRKMKVIKDKLVD